MLLVFTALLLVAQDVPVAPDGAAILGPMVGHVTPTTARIWARASGEGEFRLRLFTGEGIVEHRMRADAQNDFTMKWDLTGLEPGRTYRYRVVDEPVGELFPLRMPLPHDIPRIVKIAFGSCASDARYPRQPVWNAIRDSGAEAIVLLGDTPYIDSTDLAVQRRRYREFYSVPELAALQPRLPFYATWDDHDFGRNDTDGNLEGKENSRQAFAEYHGNPSHGEDDEGIYTSFRRGAIEVFLLDTRWFAGTEPSPADPDQPSLLGARQWKWLQSRLRASSAPFKVLACGMIWNGATRPGKLDHWMNYPHERDALFRFLGDECIDGVVLMGGDIHLSRLLKHPTADVVGYDLYEVISSPLANTLIDAAQAPHPALIADIAEPQGFVTISADSSVRPATLAVRFVSHAGATLHALDVTTDELRASAR